LNARQLELFIKQAFLNEGLSKEVLAEVKPAFAKAMADVREIVGQLPDESLMREQLWRREYFPQVERAIKPFNDALASALVRKMSENGPQFEAEVFKQLEAINALPPGPGLTKPIGSMPAYTQMALQSKIVKGTRLESLFGISRPEMAQFIKSNMRVIDNKVKQGMLAGVETKQIANSIASLMKTPDGRRILKLKKGTVAHEVNAWASAIARSGIQDMNRQVSEQVWDANPVGSDLAYEWVSALDSRTCPTCGPLDANVRPNRAAFPDWPIHFNCRCSVVLIDPDKREDVRTGIEVALPGPKGGRPPGFEKGKKGVYASKVRIKGKDHYRRTKQIKATPGQRRVTYGDYLAQSDRRTQAAFYGAGNAGSIRADNFRKWINAGKTPAEAMQKTIINMPGTTGRIKTLNPAKVRFRPDDKLKWPKDGSGPSPSGGGGPKPPGPKPKPIAPALLQSAPTPKSKFKAKTTTKASTKKPRKRKMLPPESQLTALGQEKMDGIRQVGRDLIKEKAPATRALLSIHRKKKAYTDELFKRIDAAKTPAVKAKLRDRMKRAMEIEHRALRKSYAQMEKLRKATLKTPLSNKQVEKIVNKPRFKGIDAAGQKVIRKDMDEYVRMFNGRGVAKGGSLRSTSIIEQTKDGRGWNNGSGVVGVTPGKKNQLFHELTHTLEHQDANLYEWAVGWRETKAFAIDSPKLPKRLIGKQRTVKAAPKPQFSLNDISPGRGFQSYESGYVDEYITEYMGKQYVSADLSQPGATEVITIASEMMTDAQGMLKLQIVHPDLFEMMVGLTQTMP